MKSMTLGDIRRETAEFPDATKVFINVGDPNHDEREICDTSFFEIHDLDAMGEYVTLFVPIQTEETR